MCSLPSFLLFHLLLFHSLSNISQGTIRQNRYMKYKSRVSSNTTSADPTWLSGHYFDRQSINSGLMIPFFQLVLKFRHPVMSFITYQSLIFMQDDSSNPCWDSCSNFAVLKSAVCCIHSCCNTNPVPITCQDTRPANSSHQNLTWLPDTAPTPTWLLAADNSAVTGAVKDQIAAHDSHINLHSHSDSITRCSHWRVELQCGIYLARI